jgi:Ca2+-binding EF-hand superfamily protein
VLTQSVELSSDGKRLLRRLFTSFDVNEDGLLSDAEQTEMFSASPSRSANALAFFWTHVICLSY